jgi:hypothetical protein
MKAFISFSGDLSREVGKQLKDWLAAVLQHVEPWIAVDDISKGAQWPMRLADSLTESDCGILVLCADNLSSPWLMYEAGVIAARTNMERVAGVLVDVDPSMVSQPLSLFQLTRFDRDDILKLIHQMNVWTGTPRTTETVGKAFNALWPEFEKGVRSCTTSLSNRMPTIPRDPNAMIEEILALTRDVHRRTFAAAAEDQIRLLQKELHGPAAAAGLLDGLLASPTTAVETVSIQMRPSGTVEFRPAGTAGARHSSVNTFQLSAPPAGEIPIENTSGT